MELQFLFISGLTVSKTGISFCVTIQELNLESTFISKEDVLSRHGGVSAEEALSTRSLLVIIFAVYDYYLYVPFQCNGYYNC